MTHGEQVLRNLLQQIAVEQSFDDPEIVLTSISSGGANYTSQLFVATISGNDKDDLHLFAKVAAIGEKMRAQTLMRVYDVERIVYTKLARAYQELQDKHNVPEEHRLAMPNFYGCNPKMLEETIVLENLVVQGYMDYDRFKSIDWEFASRAIDELAKLHALSFAYQHECPEEFEQLVEDVKFDWEFNDEQKKKLWEGIISSGIAATKEENREKMKNFLTKMDGNKFKRYYAPLRLTVLTHGDYRVSNLMHKINDNGRLQVKIVDYQTVQGNSPVIDLLYFIFTGSDEEFRAKHYSQLIDHYYTQLSEAMRRLGLDPDEVYSREDYDFELKEKLPFGLFIAVFILPLVTVEAENAPKVDNTMELSSFNVQKTSELFPERLNGIINDFIRWGAM